MRFLAIVSLLVLGGCSNCASYSILGEDAGFVMGGYVDDKRVVCESDLKSDDFSSSKCRNIFRHIVDKRVHVEPYTRKKGTFHSTGPLYNFEQCMNKGEPITDEILKKMATDFVERAKRERQHEVCDLWLFGDSYVGEMYNCPDITKLGN